MNRKWQGDEIDQKRTRRLDSKKHAAIVRAATRLFLKHGYSKTTMDEIAKEASVTKQTIYSHFDNKDVLFSEMVVAQCSKHAPSEVRLHDDKVAMEDLLFDLGFGFLSMITSKEGLATHRLVMSEAERRPKIAKIFYETGPVRMNTILADYIGRLNQRGVLKVKCPDAAAGYFYALLKGRLHLRMALNIKPLPTKKELTVHVKDVVQVFLRLYAGPDALMAKNSY